MKVLFLTDIGSRRASGMFAVMTAVTRELARRGIEVKVLCHDDEMLREDRAEYGEVDVEVYGVSKLPVLRQLRWSPDLYGRIEAFAPDVIHQQGMWLYYSIAAQRYVVRHPDCRLIVQPHGMLDEWAVHNSAWKKRLAGWLWERRGLRRASCVHALCEAESRSIWHYGSCRRVEVIPNGVALPDIPVEDILVRRANRGEAKHTLLYLGRIHPKKGLMEMVEALNILKEQNSPFLNEWEVKVAGWNQGGFAEQLQARIDGCGLNDAVSLVGPLFGDSKEQAYIDADAFILPSFSEGLPMTILEAWAYGLPTIQTEFCNLPEGFAADAAIKISPDAESIAQGLNRLTSLPYSTLSNMGLRGRSLVEKSFTWVQVGARTKDLYEHLISE